MPDGLLKGSPATTPMRSHARASLAPLTPSAHHQHQQSLHETFTVLNELIQEFKNCSDETSLISRMLSSKKQIGQLLSKRDGEMKELVESLTAQVDELSAATSHPPSIGLQQTQQVLNEQKQMVTNQIASLMAEVERLEAEGARLEEEKVALLKAKAECEANKSKSLPSLAGTMGLYRNFSSIAWDYDADEETHVKGTFHFDGRSSSSSKSQLQRVQPFDFDRRQLSDFEIANKLWAMME